MVVWYLAEQRLQDICTKIVYGANLMYVHKAYKVLVRFYLAQMKRCGVSFALGTEWLVS